MKMLCLTAGTKAPSSRFRIRQYEKLLAQAGVETAFRAADEGGGWLGHWIRRSFVLGSADPNVTLFLQKPNYLLFPTSAAHKLDKMPNDVIFDFDDAIFVDPATGELRHDGTLDAIKYLLARSKVVTVGNAYLADFARQHVNNVRVIPTAIDTEFYRPMGRGTQRDSVIGWVGSKQNLFELKAIKEVLLDVVSGNRCKLLVISNATDKQFHSITGIDHRNVSYCVWSERDERDRLSEIDIGLMPVNESKYALGKCGFKIIQYMAMGKPAIASAIGVNREIVVDGVTGLLVTTESGWRESLGMLIEDRARREDMGRAARERATRRYSVNAVFPQILDAIKGSAP